MRRVNFSYYMGDFETTVYKGQEYTEVWASAVVPFYSEDVAVMSSLDETFNYLRSLREHIAIYYHNLKFDGTFWLYYIINTLKYKPAMTMTDGDMNTITWLPDKDMENNTYKYLISDMGMWYKITVKTGGYLIEIRDSLKLLPFSVKKIGDSFGTKHKKTSIEYTGKRVAGGIITKEEREYIANDVLVVKEGLEKLFDEGYKKLTIGECCLTAFKNTTSVDGYNERFPDLSEFKLDETLYGQPNAERYIRLSYHGGWCYVVKGCENTKVYDGCTVDVNSLYPSMMHSSSGNEYPVGLPTFWKGNYIPPEALEENTYYFIRFKCRFKLKPNMLPTVQMKHTFFYRKTEWLETSDLYNPATDTYSPYYKELDGTIKKLVPIMTMTMTDFELFKEHYDIEEFEILDGCWFCTLRKIFDPYIDHFAEIKKTSKGARRELAKLFLNSLYGKMASNKNSSFKYAVMDGEVMRFIDVVQFNRRPGYIAIGSAITSYARNFTIRHAQKNFYGKDKKGFKYADTDSLHLDIPKEELVDIDIHPTEFSHWKVESEWDRAYFTRQKTYIEHIVKKDEEPCKPEYLIRCAGMSDRCKQLMKWSLEHRTEEEWKQSTEWEEMNDVEREFVLKNYEMEDFTQGLTVPSKLMAKRIKGGTILQETTFEMR